MELRYVGPFDEVEIVVDGEMKRVPKNGKLEAVGDQAKELLGRGDWHRWAEPGEKSSSSTGKEG